MSWGARIRKYEPGSTIHDLQFLISELVTDNYVFVRGKAMHPAVVMNWSLTTLRCLTRGGVVQVARVTKEWKAVNERALSDARVNDDEFEEVVF